MTAHRMLRNATTGRRPLVGAVAFAAVATALTLLWTIFTWGGTRASTAFDDGMQIVAPLLAVLGCGAAARREKGRQRLAWTALAASAASWMAGSTTWAWYEVVRSQPVPYPSLADVGYLAAVPLAAAGLLALSPLGRAGRWRTLFEGLVVAAAALSISWTYVIGPLYASQTGTLLQNAVGVAYPIGDVVLFTLAAILLSRTRRQSRAVIVLLCLGFLANCAADSVFTYMTSVGSYGTTNLIDAVWLLGFFAIGLAGLVRWTDRAPAIAEEVERPVGTWIPYVVLGAAIAANALSHQPGRPVSEITFWAGVTMIAAVMMRQAIAVAENRALSRRLEERVEERTRELAARERHFHALVRRSTDSISVIDAAATIVYQSPSIGGVLGYDAETLVGTQLAALTDDGDGVRLQAVLADLVQHPDHSAALEMYIRHRDGSRRACQATLTNLLGDPDVRGIVVNMRDTTERRRLEEQLTHLAFHDRLTGLPNRSLFAERLRHTLAQASRTRAATTVLFVDLDGFKEINDTLGHAVGDEVLAAVADRLVGEVRGTDTVARLGGDEFGILLDETSGEDAVQTGQRLVAALAAPLVLAQTTVLMTASIGLASTDADAMSMEELVRNADIAMYLAKAHGRGRLEVYDPSRHAEVVSDIELQAELRWAIERNQLSVFFQPVVTLADGAPVGMEALLRWRHPVRGMVPPTTFIPIAERAGLMPALGRWVLLEACSEVARWFRELGDTSLEWISVNVSARQLSDPAFIDDVVRALGRSGLKPSQLVLEITESGLVADSEGVPQLLGTLRDLGIRIAVDDFGTGYSSLSYLEQLPVDILKVDRSFVNGTSESGQLSLLARTILDLSHNLHVQTIAEGVERVEQVRSFLGQRCELGQGYLFSKPMSAAATLTYLRDRSTQLLDAAAG